ncbi:MAG TPA: Gfo/Idh/MocA family oxidoreductase [Candidatus Acidoferrales bacterium]|nr:Gfo/Idh/MocA family oxidoreductase [Candidatus Acidoferrales bacterium]
MIGVGLIGFGLAGRAFHAAVISAVPGLRLAAIVQRTGSEAAARYPEVPLLHSVDELIARSDVRLVVVATPNATHYEFARLALQAGKDVLVDKPFTTNMEDAISLVKLAKERRRLLTVYQNRRYDGDFQAIRQLVVDGALGRIVRFETSYDRFRPALKPGGVWREVAGAGAGVFFDLAPHLIDHALVLFGLPEAITADIRVERERATVDDAFDVMLHYPSGLRAVLRSTMLAAAIRPRFVLHGTKGAFVKQAFDPQEDNLRHDRIPDSGPWGAEPEENWGVLTRFEQGELNGTRVPPSTCDYRDFYANLRDAILGRASLAVSPNWALDVMQLMMLARESSETRCTVPWRAPCHP